MAKPVITEQQVPQLQDLLNDLSTVISKDGVPSSSVAQAIDTAFEKSERIVPGFLDEFLACGEKREKNEKVFFGCDWDGKNETKWDRFGFGAIDKLNELKEYLAKKRVAEMALSKDFTGKPLEDFQILPTTLDFFDSNDPKVNDKRQALQAIVGQKIYNEVQVMQHDPRLMAMYGSSGGINAPFIFRPIMMRNGQVAVYQPALTAAERSIDRLGDEPEFVNTFLNQVSTQEIIKEKTAIDKLRKEGKPNKKREEAFAKKVEDIRRNVLAQKGLPDWKRLTDLKKLYELEEIKKGEITIAGVTYKVSLADVYLYYNTRGELQPYLTISRNQQVCAVTAEKDPTKSAAPLDFIFKDGALSHLVPSLFQGQACVAKNQTILGASGASAAQVGVNQLTKLLEGIEAGYDFDKIKANIEADPTFGDYLRKVTPGLDEPNQFNAKIDPTELDVLEAIYFAFKSLTDEERLQLADALKKYSAEWLKLNVRDKSFAAEYPILFSVLMTVLTGAVFTLVPEIRQAVKDSKVPLKYKPLSIVINRLKRRFPNSERVKKYEKELKQKIDQHVVAKGGYLKDYGVNKTEEMADRSENPVANRDSEINQIRDILLRPKGGAPSNVMVTGEPGVGKTALVESFAWRVAHGQIPEFVGYQVWFLPLGGIKADEGGSYVNAMSRIVGNVFKEAEKTNNGKVILVVDEVHNLMDIGKSGSSETGVAEDIKEILARNVLKMVGMTTRTEKRQHIDKNSAFARRFDEVDLKELPYAEQKETIQKALEKAAKANGVKVEVSEELMKGLWDASNQLPKEGVQPSKVLFAISKFVEGEVRKGIDAGLSKDKIVIKATGMEEFVEKMKRDIVEGTVEEIREAINKVVIKLMTEKGIELKLQNIDQNLLLQPNESPAKAIVRLNAILRFVSAITSENLTSQQLAAGKVELDLNEVVKSANSQPAASTADVLADGELSTAEMESLAQKYSEMLADIRAKNPVWDTISLPERAQILREEAAKNPKYREVIRAFQAIQTNTGQEPFGFDWLAIDHLDQPPARVEISQELKDRFRQMWDEVRLQNPGFDGLPLTEQNHLVTEAAKSNLEYANILTQIANARRGNAPRTVSTNLHPVTLLGASALALSQMGVDPYYVHLAAIAGAGVAAYPHLGKAAAMTTQALDSAISHVPGAVGGALTFGAGVMGATAILDDEQLESTDLGKLYLYTSAGNLAGQKAADRVLQAAAKEQLGTRLSAALSSEVGSAFVKRSIPLFGALLLAEMGMKNGKVDLEHMLTRTIPTLVVASGLTARLGVAIRSVEITRSIATTCRMIKAAGVVAGPETGGAATVLGIAVASVFENLIQMALMKAIEKWDFQKTKLALADQIRVNNELVSKRSQGQYVSPLEVGMAQIVLMLLQQRYAEALQAPMVAKIESKNDVDYKSKLTQQYQLTILDLEEKRKNDLSRAQKVATQGGALDWETVVKPGVNKKYDLLIDQVGEKYVADVKLRAGSDLAAEKEKELKFALLGMLPTDTREAVHARINAKYAKLEAAQDANNEADLKFAMNRSEGNLIRTLPIMNPKVDMYGHRVGDYAHPGASQAIYSSYTEALNTYLAGQVSENPHDLSIQNLRLVQQYDQFWSENPILQVPLDPFKTQPLVDPYNQPGPYKDRYQAPQDPLLASNEEGPNLFAAAGMMLQ